MGNPSFSRNQLAFLKAETTFGIVPTITAANACLIDTMQTDSVQALIDRPDKTGSLDYLVGAAGRRSGNWSVAMSLAGSTGAGVAPDTGPLWTALAGAAPTVVASTSVTWAPSDATPPTLSIFNYRLPSTVTQQVSLGSVVDQAVIDIGQDVSKVTFSGTSLWTYDSDQAGASPDSIAAGGLGAFPAEPSSPVTTGNMLLGFKGLITLDGSTYGNMRTATLNLKANRAIPLDVFNNSYGGTPEADRREITGEIDLYDDDAAFGSGASSLKVKALGATPVTLIFQIGLTAASIYTFTVRNAQLTPFQYSDAQRKFSGKFTFKGHATSVGSKDSWQLTTT